MSKKSSKPKKKPRKFMCIYQPPEKTNYNTGFSLSYSVLKEMYYGEKPKPKAEFGEVRKVMVNPDPENWIELNFDFEEEQVFY